MQGGTLLLVHKYSNEIKLFDSRDLSRFYPIKTELETHEVVVSPDHKTAVVSNYGAHERPGTTLTVIDLTLDEKNKNIDLSPFQSPHGLQWLNDSRHILVTVEFNIS